MTNNKQLQLALEIATMAHKNVQRRNGDPYIFHALRVANNSTYIRTKTQKAAGILHDVIEDTPFDEEFLRQQGIDEAILEILRFLTHDKETITYKDYIAHICTNVDAMLVKLADLTDNLDQGTLPVLTERDIERFKTYKTAQQTIMETLAKEHPSVFQEILIDVLPRLKPRDSRLPHGKRAQFSSPTHE